MVSVFAKMQYQEVMEIFLNSGRSKGKQKLKKWPPWLMLCRNFFNASLQNFDTVETWLKKKEIPSKFVNEQELLHSENGSKPL